MSMRQRRFVSPTLLLVVLLSSACATVSRDSLSIARQGSFAVGGTVVTSPGTFDPTAQTPPGQPPSSAGQTLHGDHAYVFYQVPERARRLPLVMWHGIGQFSKTWETTPDGREGYQTIFLRRGFGVYLSTSRGAAGRHEARLTARYLPLLMSRTGSAFSGSACGRTSSQACSSHAIRRRSTSTSGR
jgi:hypothetical protein